MGDSLTIQSIDNQCEDHKFDIFGATEEDVEKRGRNPGFPLSDEVKECRIYLNRNCRNLAAHNHRPVEAGQVILPQAKP
jgi:hypothetical protein